MAKRDNEAIEAVEPSIEGVAAGNEGIEGVEVDAQAFAEAFGASVGTGSGESRAPEAAQPETEAQEGAVLLVSAKRSNYIPVSDLTPEQREERKRRNKEYRERKKTRAVGGNNNPRRAAEETALALIVITNQLVAFYFGRDCEMSEIEREMIEEPLVRMLAKTDPAKMMKVNDYTDPLLLIVGLASWGSRVYNLQEKKKPVAPEGAVYKKVEPGDVQKTSPDKRSSNGKPDYSLTINTSEGMHVG